MPNAKSNEVQIGGFSLVFLTKSQMLRARKLLERQRKHSPLERCLWRQPPGGTWAEASSSVL